MARGSQVPVQLGARFSANAIAPSLASLEVKIGMMCSSCFFHISSSVQSADLTMISLVVATASGPLAVMRSASSMRPGERLAGFGHHVDEAPRLTLFGGEAVTGQREFECLLVRNALLQAQQPAARGHQAALDLGDAELRGARRHDQVGGEHDLGAAGQRVALDRGDQRLARRPLGEADAPAGNRDDLTGGEGLQVHARAEVAARAGDHRDRQVRAVVEFVDRVGEALTDREVHRVRASGRLIVMTSTRPWRSVRISSDTAWPFTFRPIC